MPKCSYALRHFFAVKSKQQSWHRSSLAMPKSTFPFDCSPKERFIYLFASRSPSTRIRACFVRGFGRDYSKYNRRRHSARACRSRRLLGARYTRCPSSDRHGRGGSARGMLNEKAILELSQVLYRRTEAHQAMSYNAYTCRAPNTRHWAVECLNVRNKSAFW